MNLQELNSALPKPWLNIKANSVDTKTITADTFVVDELEVKEVKAESIVLENQAAVPNPAVGSMALFTDLSGVLNATDPLGTTVQYATSADLADYLPLDGSQPMSGDLDMATNNISNVGNLNGNPVSSLLFNPLSSDLDINNNYINNVFGYTLNKNISVIPNPSADNIVVFTNFNTIFTKDSGGITRQVIYGDELNLILAAYLKRDGTFAMTGSLDMGANNLENTTNVTMTGTLNMNGGLINSNSGGIQDVFDYKSIAPLLVNGNNGGPNAAGIAIGGGPAALAQIDATFINPCAIGNNASASNDETISIGSNSAASALRAVSLGFGTNNSIPNSVLLGDPAVVNVRPNDDNLCDLGSVTNRFKDLYVNNLRVVQGANQSAGSGAVLVAGTVTVATTSVSTGDIVLLSCTALGGVPGVPCISAIVNGVSFDITSSSGADTSTYSWVIIKQA